MRPGFAVPAFSQEASDDARKGYASLAPVGALVTHVVVLEGETFGADVPHATRQQCRRLAEICQTQLLGVDLFVSPVDPWTFAGASPLPDLQIGGNALLRRMGQALQNRNAS